MSIINEALKKAQEEKSAQPVAAETRVKTVAEPAKIGAREIKSAPAKKIGKRYLFILVMVAAGSAAGAVFLRNQAISEGKNFVKPRIVPARRAVVAAKKVPTKPNSRSVEPILALNGIVYDEEKPYAIVNDKVLMKGDTVDGATVSDITRDTVKFIWNDKEFEVSAK